MKVLFNLIVLNYAIILGGMSVAFPACADKCDFIQYNQCVSCDALYAFSVGSDEACSYLCPNREVNHYGSGSSVVARNCALKKCPDNAPFQSEYGSCFATEEEARKDTNPVHDNSNDDNQQEYTNAPQAQNGKCPKNLPLLYSDKCYACDEPKVIRIETHCNIEEDCEDVCPNRTILYWVGGNVPSVPNCPKDKPLMDSEGICYACDAPVPVGLEWNTRLCQRFCPDNRHLEWHNCVLNE